MPVMDKTSDAGFIDDHLGRHAPELEEIDFLPVQLEHAGFWIGQTNKRQVVLAPVGGEGQSIFRPNHDDLSLATLKFLVVMAQLHHMLLAERSEKAPVENEQHIRLPAKIGQADQLIPEVLQGKIGCRGVNGYFWHDLLGLRI